MSLLSNQYLLKSPVTVYSAKILKITNFTEKNEYILYRVNILTTCTDDIFL